LLHATIQTAWAESTLAGECDEAFVGAAPAAYSGKASRQIATCEKALKLFAYVSWVAIAVSVALLKHGEIILADHPMQGAIFWPSPGIRPR
jgi:glucosamine 6-phosphate synthetase-like amidotransferase/phosphosugar isomerase protein